MDLGLVGKNALVTGASYGIGYACAKTLAEEGVNVAICSRNADKIRSSAEEIASKSGSKVAGFTADLTNENDLMRLVQESKGSLGNIDILVVSTGHPPTYPFSVATDEHWKHGTDLVLRPDATSQNVSVEKVLNDWAEYAPVKRFGKPDDLGAMVAFLASAKAEFITGTTVTMDGGAVRRY